MTKEEDDALFRHLCKHIEGCEMPNSEPVVTIPRVPLELVEANKKYYMPALVTIGPYHALQVSSDSKLESEARFVNSWKRSLQLLFIVRLHQRMGALSGELIRSEMALRNCYEEVSLSCMNRASFLEMMLLDGCFIVMILYMGKDDVQNELLVSDFKRMKYVDFGLDLLKFDNQLPFFFLESLYEMIQPEHDDDTSFVNCALSFLGTLVFGFESYKFGHIDLSTQPASLLHLAMIALFHLPPSAGLLSDRRLFPSFGTPASKLEDYGVKFRKRRNSRFITDIVFRNGVLEIPALVLDGSSASLFSNLLAAEMQYVAIKERWVISYVFFMDGLIKDVNDLKVLRRAGIFECRVSDPTKLVSLFRDLASANALGYSGGFMYADQVREMKDYCASVGPRLRAYLKQAFKDWDAFNGILLLILTVTQTLFSILGYSPSSANHNNNKN